MTSDDVFDAISHPLRIEILQELAKRPSGFADLKRKFKIKSSGLLDFHLKKMSTLVTTDRDGLYQLNDRGFAALQAVNIVSHHGWQRRSWYINLGTYILMNSYFIMISSLWFLAFIPTTAWIVFYSYWTFVKRRVRLRTNGSES
ncbi:MAG: helix-turn-helix domain-containing protein [Candidatus Thorarchaeota archaeon]